MNSETESRLLALELQYERIEKKLDQILEVIDKKISKSCNKMSSHIDFVENVYDNVKAKQIFWDEVTDYPSVCVYPGAETREYLPGDLNGHFLL